MDRRLIAAAASLAALAVPTTAVASPHHGAGQPPAAADHARGGAGKAKAAHTVTFVFHGTFTAPGTVAVTSGNAPVRKGGFIGQAVTFDLSRARIVAADTNGDQAVDPTDVKDGDRVLVQARLPKRTAYSAPAGDGAAAIVAARLVDQTSQSTDD